MICKYIEQICCNQNDEQKFDKILKKIFFNTSQFFNHDKKHFYSDIWKILLLQIMLMKKEFVKTFYENIMFIMFKTIHYCYLMYLRTLEMRLLKCMS